MIDKQRIKLYLSLIFFILLFLVINYKLIDKELTGFFIEYKTGVVQRIVDGDTIILDNQSIRLLGINTPEKKEYFYSEAKEFLNKTLLNKTVRLEYGREKYDKYKRELAFIFLDNKNINIEIVKNGFANVYILNDKKYEKELRNAWDECIKNNLGFCEKSLDKCSLCIILNEISVEKQEITFQNLCNFSCNLTDWSIKDEGRKKFIFPSLVLDSLNKIKIVVDNKTNNLDDFENIANSNKILYWNNESYVLTKGGDTIFLRDNKSKLVLWKFIR